jgi:hypothetical protein
MAGPIYRSRQALPRASGLRQSLGLPLSILLILKPQTHGGLPALLGDLRLLGFNCFRLGLCPFLSNLDLNDLRCGSAGRPVGGGLALVMDRPRSVAAVYVYEPDLLNLGILAGTVAAGVALYVSGRRRGWGAPAEEPQPTCPACGAAVTGDSLFCHRHG